MSNNCSRNQRKGSRNQRKGSRNQRKGSRNQRKGSRNQRKGSRNQRKGSRNQRKGSRNQRKGSRNQRKGSRNQRKRSIKKNRRQYGGQVCSNDGTTSSTKPFAHLNSVNNNNGDTTPSPSYIFLGENNQEIKMYAPASNNNVALLASDDQ